MPKISPGQRRLPERNRAKALYEKQLPAHKAALQQLAQAVRQILEQQGLTPAIKFRVKNFEAYFDKLRRQNQANGGQRIATINDFFGLRIVCPFLEDVETVSSLIAKNFDLLETESKASQHSFREFGYDSVHQSIRLATQQRGRLLPGVKRVCEIQLRTILQDAWAEVEHELVYKSDISLPNRSIRRKLASLNATLTLSDLIFQEIRDYQKELRRHGRKRRDIAAGNLNPADDISIFHPAASAPPARLGPIPSTLASHLERTMLRALQAHSNQELETAIALYSQLLGMQLERKMRGLVYNHRGMAYFAMGNYQRALKDFANSIKYDPESDQGYANRGLCYRLMNKHDRALKDFAQAIKLNPGRPDNFFGRAQAHHDLRQYSQARLDCEKALSIDPDYQAAKDMLKSLQNHLV